MASSDQKKIKKIVREAIRQGWTIQSTKNHIKLRTPENYLVVMPATPSDWRSVQNSLAVMKRHGFDPTNVK